MLAKDHHPFLQEMEAIARGYAGANVERLPSGLAVKGSGPDGFDMAIVVEDGRYALYFDNWAEEFECDEIARRLLEAALKGDARLRVDLLSGRRWRWTLEMLDESGYWLPESTISHVIWRFWGRHSSVYLRNAYTPLAPPSDVAESGIRAD
jgi:hypothetical protein